MSIPWQDHVMNDGVYRDLSNYVEDPSKITPTTKLMKPIGESIWLLQELGEDDNHQGRSSSSSSSSFCTKLSVKQWWNPVAIKLASSNLTAAEASAKAATFLPTMTKSTSPSPSCRQQQEYHNAVVVGLQESGGAWVWNPSNITLTKALAEEIKVRCGGVRHLVVPNYLRLLLRPNGSRGRNNGHRRRLQEWSRAFPHAKLYISPDYDLDKHYQIDESEEDDDDYEEKYKSSDGNNDLLPPLMFDCILTDDTPRDFALELDQIIVRGSNFVDEVVFWHKASRTILMSDFIQEKQMISSPALAAMMTTMMMDDPDAMMMTMEQGESSSTDTTSQFQYATSDVWKSSFESTESTVLARKAVNSILTKWKSPLQMVLSKGGQELLLSSYSSSSMRSSTDDEGRDGGGCVGDKDTTAAAAASERIHTILETATRWIPAHEKETSRCEGWGDEQYYDEQY